MTTDERNGLRRGLELFLLAYGAVALTGNVASLTGAWRHRVWNAGFTAGTRAARVLDEVRRETAEAGS